MNFGIFVEKNFPDKICPGSGFYLNHPVSYIFFKRTCRYNQNNALWWSHIFWMSPGHPDPVFWTKIRFSKNLIFEIYMIKETFWQKNFPDKLCPGSGFALKCPVFYIYLNMTHRSIQNFNYSLIFFSISLKCMISVFITLVNTIYINV